MTSQSKPSRQFSILDVPDPSDIKAKFVYNFFSSDERINSSGDPRVPGSSLAKSTQRLIKSRTLRSEIPRLIDINFSPGTIIEFGNINDQKNAGAYQSFGLEHIQDEASVTTDSFMFLSESDPDVRLRASQKLEALSDLLEIPFEDSDQTTKLSLKTGLAKKHLQSLVEPDKRKLLVNFIEEGKNLDLYDVASNIKINTQLNMRVAHASFSGTDDASPLSATIERSKISEISRKFKSSRSSDLTSDDLEINIAPYAWEAVPEGAESGLLSVSHVGYVLAKSQMTPSGKKRGTTEILLRGTENTNYIDTRIVYGSKYTYNVKNVYMITAITSFNSAWYKGKGRVTFFIKSKPSKEVTVITEEFMAPDPPDGVFYQFNYDDGKGLIMTWQPPIGRSRDVKYFQIFKRSSIYEPFMCIGEIDFDDSKVKTLKPEKVRDDKITNARGMQTYFEDKTFNRESPDAIYAVSAVDAHGYTSTYSSQTLVSFDNPRNKIILRNISRPGAPKQYPNFFVDPRLDENIAVDSFSQDALFDSGRRTARVYFTPDAKLTADRDGNVSNVFTTSEKSGKYKLHVINVDLQTSADVEIKIDDLRTT